MLQTLALSTLLFAACTTDASTTPDGRPPRDGQGSLGEGLPCEVVRTLESHCWGCHGVSPTANAPFALATVDDLRTPAREGATRAARAVTRMRDNARPMPPAGARATEPEIAAVEQWVAAGLAESTCNQNNCKSCDQLLDDVVACMPPMALPQFCDATDGPLFYQCAVQKCATQCALAAPGQTPPACDVMNGPSCRSCVTTNCTGEIVACGM